MKPIDLDMNKLREGRQARARDSATRSNLQLRRAGILYKAQRPFLVYRDGAGQEFIRIRQGIYVTRDEFDRGNTGPTEVSHDDSV